MKVFYYLLAWLLLITSVMAIPADARGGFSGGGFRGGYSFSRGFSSGSSFRGFSSSRPSYSPSGAFSGRSSFSPVSPTRVAPKAAYTAPKASIPRVPSKVIVINKTVHVYHPATVYHHDSGTSFWTYLFFWELLRSHNQSQTVYVHTEPNPCPDGRVFDPKKWKCKKKHWYSW